MRKIGLVVLAVVVIGMASCRMGDKSVEESRSWLSERSAWSETTPAGRHPRGWWGVGNSRVFGIVGPGLPAAQLSQITGPHIMLANVMNNGSAFGPATLHLAIGGKPAKFTEQRLSKVRGTNIVVMDYTGPDVDMSVTTYAPFDANAILRTVTITNHSQQPLADVVLTAAVNRTIVKDGGEGIGVHLFDSFKGSTGGGAMGQTRQLFSFFIEEFTADGPKDKPGRGTLTANIGTIGPGGEAARTHVLAFSMKEVGDEKATLAYVRTQGTKLLRKTRDDWRSWLATTTRLECPDQRLIDLLDDTKMLVKIQTAEPQAAAGPMEFFAGVWARDSNGPFIYYLRMGRLDMARRMLDFYYRASAANKHIANNLPMDVDMTRPIDPKLDWTKVRVEHAEIPCWVILQHRWYYQYSGDLEPIRKHWPYLKRCLYGQLVNTEGQPVHTANYGSHELGANKMYRFPYHGDETWIYPGFEVLNSQVFPEPNDHPHWDSFSADSTWEFVASADAMAKFAALLGKKNEARELAKIAKDSRAACERDYWMPERGLYAVGLNMRSLDRHQPPFPMVNFNPIWIGYLKGSDPKAVSNVVETMKYTLNPNFVTDATETLRVYVGMQPGMFLYNLAAIDHPFAEPALHAMMGVAAPSGEYTEKHVTERTSHRSGFRGHRIRPWEGGINADAAYYYLTGLDPDLGNGRIALCPRMPAGWKKMAVTGQALADGKLDVRVADDSGTRTYKLKWTGSKPITVAFTISLPQAAIKSVTVNGSAVKVAPASKWGLTTATLDVRLARRKTTTIAVAYEKTKPVAVAVTRQRYKYIVPKNVPPYDLVLWENEPRKGPKDRRTFDYLKGKVNYRLISAFNPASPAWLRPFLLKPDGTPNTPIFVMGPNSVANSLKWAKWWGDPQLAKLFNDYMNAGGAIVAISTGESSSGHFGTLLGDSAYSTAPAKTVATVPAAGPGKAACDLLQLFAGKTKPVSNKMFLYKNMVVLGRPETEPAAATVLAKKVGKGFFLTMLTNPGDYEGTARIALAVAKPPTLAELNKLIGTAKPEAMAGAFKDYSKNGAFFDDFSKYKNGSTGLPVWQPIHGHWSMQNGEYHQLITHGYDFCTTANARVKGDYKIETVTKRVKGIQEGGFLFNLPSRFSKSGSQMVRFCGQEALWCGPFSGGGMFTLEKTVATGKKVRDDKWTTLTVTVRNSKGTYDIAVDGKQVAKGLKLTNVLEPGKSGYVGLVACRGHIAYKSIRITPLK